MRRISEHEVEFTEVELLFKELYDLQLDQGLGHFEALDRLRGSSVPEQLRSNTPILNSILTDEFISYQFGCKPGQSWKELMW